MRRVAFLAGLVGVAICPAVGACTPAMDERVAIELQGDSIVRVDILLCENESLHMMSLSELASSASLEWRASNQSPEDRTGEAEWFSATLLEPPTGWAVEVDTLSELKDEVAYFLYVWTSDPPEFTMTFSLADLRGLEPDRVLVATQRGARAMNRGDFDRGAWADCD